MGVCESLCGKDWVDILSALGTPIIALLTGGFAVWYTRAQWQTAQQTRKHLLTEKYYQNYLKLNKACRLVHENGDTWEAFSLSSEARDEAQLMLSKEIAALGVSIWLDISELHVIRRRLGLALPAAEETELVSSEARLLQSLGSTQFEAIEKYRKFLALDD